METKLQKAYNPSESEDIIYERWTNSEAFHADPQEEQHEKDGKQGPFCVVIPPPNVTGQLHMGHAMNITLQDIIVRVKRMQGFDALWLPGTDHAGIATQIKVEEYLRDNYSQTRYDLGREAFIELVWEWKNKFGNIIINQLKKLGASCDWRKERFTMDEGCSKAVREAFVLLWEKGLIYRGFRIINHCPNCSTALSDAEVEHEEKEGNLWYIKYPLKNSSDYLIVATTRPETMLGDVAVAVNPTDERYQHLIGQKAILPLMTREIPIIADDYVDIEFGTGCVKITPFHDPNDFEIAERHGITGISILDSHGKIINAGDYNGLDRYEARKLVISNLTKENLLIKTEAHLHNVGSCHRCGTVIEPLASLQWFVKMDPLAKPAIDIVMNDEIEFLPERFGRIYLNWMENIRDWCISRQLWWGHRIPAWYCKSCDEILVAREKPENCSKCGHEILEQDPDVLDTWFSSALWPFSTLGWPEDTKEYRYFYPTNTLVTAYDIIPFWVARMIFSGLEYTSQKPFSRVFIHGLVRDTLGRKMSKSLGNGIDPLEIIEKYGADALRFTLIFGTSPGNDMRFNIERIEAGRNFANKLWNASRFVLANAGEDYYPLPKILEREDKWILTELNVLITEITDNIERCDLGVALQKIYDFAWDNFCDWYIEFSKPRLLETDSRSRTIGILLFVLDALLKCLHPFMPFVTEEIFGHMPGNREMLVLSNWPKPDKNLMFEKEHSETIRLMDAIRAIRNRRAEMNVPISRKAKVYIVSKDEYIFRQGEMHLKKLAGISEVIFKTTVPEEQGMTHIVSGSDTLTIPTEDLIDIEEERSRLQKELDSVISEMEKLTTKLNNQAFLEKAPERVVTSEQNRFEQLLKSKETLSAALKILERD